MTFWEKIAENPAYCAFEGASLEMLTMKKTYLHVRLCLDGNVYPKYEQDLKDEYLDPSERELFIDMVFLSPTILREQSQLPPKITFGGEVYWVTALTEVAKGVYCLSLSTFDKETYSIQFTAKECIAKPFTEMDCSFYFNHPEIFDKPFSLKEFMGRKN